MQARLYSTIVYNKSNAWNTTSIWVHIYIYIYTQNKFIKSEIKSSNGTTAFKKNPFNPSEPKVVTPTAASTQCHSYESTVFKM